MKKIISIFAFFLFLVVGCTDQSNLTSPEISTFEQEPNWILLPQSDNLGVELSISASKTIEGDKGGPIAINKSYKASTGKTVNINAQIYFPSNAFSGTKFITMTVDDATCTVTFSPSMVFDVAAEYTVTYTNIDLNNIDPSTVKFAYISTNGSVQYAQHEGITVDLLNGKLSVLRAKIPHFSRYGFVN